MIDRVRDEKIPTRKLFNSVNTPYRKAAQPTKQPKTNTFLSACMVYVE